MFYLIGYLCIFIISGAHIFSLLNLFIFIFPFVHVSFSLTFPTPFTRSFVFPTALGEKTSSVISGQTPTLGTCATPPRSPHSIKMLQLLLRSAVLCGGHFVCWCPLAVWWPGRTDGRVRVFVVVFLLFSHAKPSTVLIFDIFICTALAFPVLCCSGWPRSHSCSVFLSPCLLFSLSHTHMQTLPVRQFWNN